MFVIFFSPNVWFKAKKCYLPFLTAVKKSFSRPQKNMMDDRSFFSQLIWNVCFYLLSLPGNSPKEMLTKYLDQYLAYLQWTDNHFSVGSYFIYDRDLFNIEDYILSLPIFNNQPKKKTWNDIFQIEFKDWNLAHYLLSDLSGISQQLESKKENLQLEYNGAKLEQFKLQSIEKKYIPASLSINDQKFLQTHGTKYVKSIIEMQKLVEHKILVTPVPIKLQTMLEKKLLIENFAETVDWYNEWVSVNGVGTICATGELENNMQDEINKWHSTNLLN
jgi:hypothetical protein